VLTFHVIQNPHTILIVDDNPAVSDVLVLLFTHAGFNVLRAEDGRCGCAVAEEQLPSLIICDERMPRMDGYSTLLRLKATASTAHIPVIMIGGTDVNGERDWPSCGAASFLPKPFKFSELLAVVGRVLSLQPQ
jgi:DNA-binding response OmpR family regulator